MITAKNRVRGKLEQKNEVKTAEKLNKMSNKKLSSEQRFIRNLLIGFFTALFIVFVLAIIALFQTLINYPNDQEVTSIIIQSCYDGGTSRTIQGEKIRLAYFDTPKLRSTRADSIRTKASNFISMI